MRFFHAKQRFNNLLVGCAFKLRASHVDLIQEFSWFLWIHFFHPGRAPQRAPPVQSLLPAPRSLLLTSKKASSSPKRPPPERRLREPPRRAHASSHPKEAPSLPLLLQRVALLLLLSKTRTSLSPLRTACSAYVSTSEVRLSWTPEEKPRHEVNGHAEYDNQFEFCVTSSGISTTSSSFVTGLKVRDNVKRLDTIFLHKNPTIWTIYDKKHKCVFSQHRLF